MGKHTPGPWRVETLAHPPGIDICTDEHEPWFIAEVHRAVGFDGDDHDANARLIAAAPDLLAAVMWLETYAKVQVTRHPEATDTPNWQRVLDAIAKATQP